jgi:hypothetical protein
MFQDRFHVPNPLPDSFVYLPEHLGGLGLRNPFVGLFLVRNILTKNPEDHVREYLEEERDQYLSKKKDFEKIPESGRKARLNYIYPDEEIRRKGAIRETEYDVYPSLDEFSRFREHWSWYFHRMFVHLTSCPGTEEIALSKPVKRSLDEFLSGSDADAASVDAEKKWFIELYSKELLENYGGVTLVDKQFLPVGVLSMMRAKKVSWNMVL